MFLVDVFSGLLRPACCLACGVPAAWPCCDRCLPPDPGGVGPWTLAADPDLVCWALGPYRDALRAAVLAGKLDGQPAALTELGRRLGAALAEGGVGADLVTWVAARRVAGQPRDHAERIARGLAATLELPVVDLLGPAGGRDLGRARRARSPLRPPPTRPPPRARRRLAGGRVLLVDDLVTTGATLAGAADTLRRAGARQVEAAVLATAPAVLATAAFGTGPAALATAPGALATASAVVPGAPAATPGVLATDPIGPAAAPGVLAARPSALVMEVALCGCDPFSCVESGQYDRRAVKEVSPYAEVIWQAGPCVPFGLQGSVGGMTGSIGSCPATGWGSCPCR
jgi:predicted amidophosphoribosyltransferase